MNNQFSKKGLMIALSACVFALGSFIAINAYADWTAWLDRDNPSGDGDWEHLSAFIDEGADVCPNPTEIEARRISDQLDAAATGQAFLFYNPGQGFACRNEDQPSDVSCFDYEVRFLCGVCCLDYERPAPDGWIGHPDFNLKGFNQPVFPPIEDWKPVSMERFLSCYEYHFPGGELVTLESCKAALDKSYPIPPEEKMVQVLSAHWFPYASLKQLKKLKIIPRGVKLLATGVNLTATVNGSGVDLTLTTDAEPDTAALLILSGDKRENGGTEIDVACNFASGGSPYTCTDDPVADTYRAAEIEYDGSLIIYDVVTPE